MVGDRDRLKQVVRTCSTTPPGTARPAAGHGVRAVERRRHSCSRSATRARHPAAGSATAGLRTVHPGRAGRPTAAPASAWPSPAGSSTCTAARSRSSTRSPAVRRLPHPLPRARPDGSVEAAGRIRTGCRSRRLARGLYGSRVVVAARRAQVPYKCVRTSAPGQVRRDKCASRSRAGSPPGEVRRSSVQRLDRQRDDSRLGPVCHSG